MPNAKKFEFVPPKYPRRRKQRSVSDPFYFDAEAWARLEAEVYGRKLPTMKGDKRPRAEVERKMASQRANKLRRQEAFLAKRDAERRAARYAGPALSDRLLDAMAPGAWYGERDLCEAVGLPPDAVKPTLYQKLARRGLVARKRNPAWAGKLDPIRRKVLGAGNVEPLVLWGLTEKGIVEQGRARIALASFQAGGRDDAGPGEQAT